MTDEDRNGWWEAPAGTHWTCPECDVSSAVERWEYCETACEDCGDHEARECPECGERFEHVWGAPRIARATAGES